MKSSKKILTLIVALFTVGLIGCSKTESTTTSSLEDTSLEETTNNMDSTQNTDNEEVAENSSFDYDDNSEKEQTTENESSTYSNNTSTYSSTNNSSSYDDSDDISSKHIGKSVYIANGNRYYHAISNCKYLEGASTSLVTLTSDMDKFECNCWTNPVEYEPPTSSSNVNSTSETTASGQTVYIASGNSYYHNSPSCKFLNGASAKAVDLNNVGGKHACNCVKY